MTPKSTTFYATDTVRLDTFLSSELGVTRNQIVQLIKQDAVMVEGKKVSKPGLKLKIGQEVNITFPEAKVTPAKEIDFDVEILYEDDDLLVINKPSGLTVHPAPSVKEPTLVDWLKHKNIRLSTLSGEERHGIVHRLDKGTSGVMVVAKNNEAHEALSAQLQDKSMGRYYLAVINPPLKEAFVTVDKPIGRSSQNRLKMAEVAGGKEARTLFKKLALSKDEKNELIACKLFTGRTHQIRVHLETFSRHILGDHLYGIKNDKQEQILLHAYVIYFIHPTTKKRCQFSAPLSKAMKEYLEKNFDQEIINEQLPQENFERHFDISAA
ncbi:RluA family pseudouridine synthase [Sulfurimonas sp. HSL3-7]|uniref:RluA family pseudouridine synthase n=1 Tax=Sulfonitrofixus jiaomeiensis TaxID=3131938 RepID=UPI0031F8CEA2